MDQSINLEPQLLDHTTSDLELSSNSEILDFENSPYLQSKKNVQSKVVGTEEIEVRALQTLSLNIQTQPAKLTVSNENISVTDIATRRSDEQYCLTHNKVLDIICTDDQALICSSCAIFCHKGHEFKSLKDFEADKLAHCQQLLELTDAKKTLQSSISGQQAVNSLKEQFETLKGQLSQQIKNKFKSIIELVNLAQDRCLERVYRRVIQEEERVKSLMSIPIRILETYKKWETLAYEQIRKFENDRELDEQMKILNYGGRPSDSFIGQGQSIILELKKYQQAISGKLTDSLTSFTLQFDPQIERRLANVQDNLLKKYKKLPTIDIDNSMCFSTIGDQSMSEDLLNSQHKPTFSISNFDDSNSSRTISTGFIPSMIKTNRRSTSIFDQNFESIHPLRVQSSQISNQGPATMRFPVSPSQKFALPSPRCFVSPSRHREITSAGTAQQRIKKILVRLKLSDKYQKIVSSAIYQNIQIFDLTNCGLDQNAITCIIELAKSNKSIKSLKLIRNRLTDDGLQKIIPHLANISILNLSQNHLSDRSLDILLGNLQHLTNLRSLILTQNRIKEKTLKPKLQDFKRSNISIII